MTVMLFGNEVIFLYARILLMKSRGLGSSAIGMRIRALKQA